MQSERGAPEATYRRRSHRARRRILGTAAAPRVHNKGEYVTFYRSSRNDGDRRGRNSAFRR